MQSLQDYILESYEDVNEGKVWDSIKKWFSNLFTPSSKKYDRFAKDFDDKTNADYITYLKSSFNEKHLTVKKITSNSILQKVIHPLNTTPSKVENRGFWKFADFEYKNESFERLFMFEYEDGVATKDVIALIYSTAYKDVPEFEKFFEIKKLQILPDLEEILTLPKLIKVYKKFIVTTTRDQMDGIYIAKNSDPDLYQKLINDCGFEKVTINSRNYAKSIWND